MKRPITMFFLFLAALGMVPSRVFADGSSPIPSPSPTLTFDEQKKELELERLELENQKLKLELEEMKVHGDQSPSSQSNPSNKNEEQKRAMDAYQTEITQKAEALAKANKEKQNALIVDFVNSEIWNQGVRYDLHELYDMADDHQWKMDQSVEERAPNGEARNLFTLKNLSLLKYENKKRGIMTLKAKAKDDDFELLTPEGITLDSTSADVRNAYQSVYFSFDGQAYEGKIRRLKYIHKQDWNFADRLEFDFDKDGKLVQIRYGVLDEH